MDDVLALGSVSDYCKFLGVACRNELVEAIDFTKLDSVARRRKMFGFYTLVFVENADGTWTMNGQDEFGNDISVDVTSMIDPLNDDLAHVKDMLKQANKLLDKLNGKTITNWVEKFTNKFDKLINNNADQMLQPVLLAIDKNGNVNRVSGIKAAPYEAEGEVRLEATTYTAELFAPAYVKFVGCKDITADGFNELIFSNSKVLKFTPEKGKLYEIVYEAVDFFGNTYEHTYYIQGK